MGLKRQPKFNFYGILWSDFRKKENTVRGHHVGAGPWCQQKGQCEQHSGG